METFVKAKPFVWDLDFRTSRAKALRNMDLSDIDEPIAGLIESFTLVAHCFTLQSCWGHSVHDGQPDPHGCETLAGYSDDTQIRFRLAYIALCLENSRPGHDLREELCSLVSIDPACIQFGSAEWFWKQHVNSYVLQVEPERYKDLDYCTIGIEEALYLEKLKARIFQEIRKIIEGHSQGR